MRSLKIDKLLLFVLLVPTVTSLIISSVYAGKKKFKTFSFDSPLLPAIVKVQPHRFHLTFRQNKYLKTPEFKIEGTLPLKAPSIVKEIVPMDPEPEVSEYNIGDMLTTHEEEQPYSESNVHQNIAPVNEQHMAGQPIQHPLPPLPPHDQQVFVDPPIVQHSNDFHMHRQMKRSENDYKNQFHTDSQNHYFSQNYGQNFQIPHQTQTQPNFDNQFFYNNNHNQHHNQHQHQHQYQHPHQYQNQYQLPPNEQNYFNPNNAHNSQNNNQGITPFNNYNSPHIQHSENSYHPNYQNNPIHQSSTSFTPQKYEKIFVSPNQQNTGWTPITNGHNNYPQPPNNPNTGYSPNGYEMPFHNYGDTAETGAKKVNIGEHYNPSASYMDETVVTKPTYDPDEGSISFSISGPHGGEKVPLGYEEKIKEQYEQLKKYPDHLPPGLDVQQLVKYYHQQTFTDGLKNDYGYVAATGPLGFLKSKLSSLKKLL